MCHWERGGEGEEGEKYRAARKMMFGAEKQKRPRDKSRRLTGRDA